MTFTPFYRLGFRKGPLTNPVSLPTVRPSKGVLGSAKNKHALERVALIIWLFSESS